MGGQLICPVLLHVAFPMAWLGRGVLQHQIIAGEKSQGRASWLGHVCWLRWLPGKAMLKADRLAFLQQPAELAG